jgi:hypothetical protein
MRMAMVEMVRRELLTWTPAGLKALHNGQ